MSIETLAFLTGLLGSLHCMIMCGPLVMSLPLRGNSWSSGLIQRLIYQLGRILTYSAFGFIAGSIGKGFNILGLQQLLSLTSGLFLIAIALIHFTGNRMNKFSSLQFRIVKPIASKMGQLLSRPYGSLFAGTLHGLLPCGMVYMAIAASLNTGSPVSGGKFMFFFGLGTTPLLLLVSLTPLFLRKFKVPQLIIPALFLLTGLFLISRGLNLSIPHITSPVITGQSISPGKSIPVCR
jgi:sulfite exporter TauE/SafE